MAFKDGDFVLVEYSLRLKDTNQLIDTTSEEEAKKEGIYDEDRVYGPELVIIGEGRLIPGLEEAIKEMNVNEKKEVEIPPEKAYGVRDPNKVKTYSVKQFLRHGVRPEIGKLVEINGQVGRIIAVEGGRVKVDFNHPLAGRTLLAVIRVVAKLEKDEDKIKHLVARRLRAKPDYIDVNVDRENGVVTIKMKPQAALRATPSTKVVLLDEIRRYFDWARRVNIVEEYEIRAEKKEQEQQ
ncbi:peptidylprolyl isomerase FKBP-type [Pyrolobus fumarii 1A]|uniref:Peptidyl-prolyl cis-trans isomerase n=1 Tax=Pyrolobus fumarii (strain DSM 11204 / 1A) TaxID=694429 RepID=G0EEX0_PYRF1|nr:peptidylprolyl isomerase [Pyrolobus fumarii]AEM38084.1 peptidylprolyl isomerase FKBP-type [Pyrolobus fumarii 1A]